MLVVFLFLIWGGEVGDGYGWESFLNFECYKGFWCFNVIESVKMVDKFGC